MTTVCIVDDHEVVREGLRSLVASMDTPAVESVWSVGSGADALAIQRKTRPDLFVVDYRLPDMTGDGLCAALLAECPTTTVIVLTSYPGEDIVQRCLQSGASAYVSKDAGLAELRCAFAAVASGKRRVVCRPSAFGPLSAESAHDGDRRGLTQQQLRVLELLAEGLTYGQIGRQLYIAESTVRFHINGIKEKFNVQTKAEMIVIGVRQALISPPIQTVNVP